VEYALNTDKSIIPIRIHRSYVLDGWLSTSLASHSLLNFADTEDFEAGMSLLLQRVSAITGPLAASDVPGKSYTQVIITLRCCIIVMGPCILRALLHATFVHHRHHLH